MKTNMYAIYHYPSGKFLSYDYRSNGEVVLNLSDDNETWLRKNIVGVKFVFQKFTKISKNSNIYYPAFDESLKLEDLSIVEVTVTRVGKGLK